LVTVHLSEYASALQAQCAVISECDGRWRAMDCSAALPTACRSADANWMLMPGKWGSCPEGFTFEVPHTAKENLMLQAVLHVSPLGASSAWLPITGEAPCLRLPDLASHHQCPPHGVHMPESSCPGALEGSDCVRGMACYWTTKPWGFSF
jgi:hypothetical protein